MMNRFEFQKQKTLEQRKSESSRLRSNYVERVPCIVENYYKTVEHVLPRSKFLVPKDLTSAQFLYVIRKNLTLKPEQALFLFVGKCANIPPASELIMSIDSKYADQDGFLYFSFSLENTFGTS